MDSGNDTRQIKKEQQADKRPVKPIDDTDESTSTTLKGIEKNSNESFNIDNDNLEDVKNVERTVKPSKNPLHILADKKQDKQMNLRPMMQKTPLFPKINRPVNPQYIKYPYVPYKHPNVSNQPRWASNATFCQPAIYEYNRHIPNPQTFYHHKKTALDYLREIAAEENYRLTKRFYEKNSFSSENLNRKKLKQIKSINNKNKEEVETQSSKEPKYDRQSVRTNSKQSKVREKGKKAAVCEDELSIEYNVIESFADFEDNLFPFRIQNNSKMYSCPKSKCNVKLPSLSRIKRHYLIHTNLKPFKCLSNKCDKRFSRKDNMLQHYRVHCKSKKQ